MKTDREKLPNCFRWLRAIRAKHYEETKHMTDEEYCAYLHASAEEYDRERRLSTSKAGKATPPRKAKVTAKTTASRRKALKRLAHA